MTESGSRFSPRAREIFERFLKEREAGGAVNFEDLCEANRSVEMELRMLFAACELLGGFEPKARGDGEIPKEWMENFSFESDPGSEGDFDAGPGPDSSSEFVNPSGGGAPQGTRYRVIGEIARGGMGVILCVWDGELRRRIAMKVVLDKESDGETIAPIDPRTLVRFLEEAQITGQLNHPGIVPVHAIGQGTDGRDYFTMRLVNGVNLKKVFEHVQGGVDGWSQVRALGVILKVCEAMSYAHDKGVIHRDLKPANVMVGKYGEVYVMDWGLARVLGREDKHDLRIRTEASSGFSSVKTERQGIRDAAPDSPLVTMDGDVVGTPSFMPPEQASGHVAQLGARSDVYSVGAMLYQLLSAEMPYVPKDARLTPHTVLAAVVNGPPRTLHDLAPSTAPELTAICEKAMARKIDQRYESMTGLADDLRAYVEGRVVKAYETGPWAEARKWVQRNRGLAAALAVAVVLLTAGIGALADINSKANEIQAKEKQIALEAIRTDAMKVAARVRASVRDRTNWRFVDRLEWNSARLWLDDARALVKGDVRGSRSSLTHSLGLHHYEKILEDLRAEAEPRIPEDKIADLAVYRREKTIEAREEEIHWRERMLCLEPWPVEPASADIEREIASSILPSDCIGLNSVAFRWVNPDGPRTFGNEVKALAVAKSALERAKTPIEIGRCLDTLAFTLCRTGNFEGARSNQTLAIQMLQAAVDAENKSRGPQTPEQMDASNEDQTKPYLWLRSVQGNLAHQDDERHCWESGEERTIHAVKVAELRKLEREAPSLGPWTFKNPELGWWHDKLTELVEDLRVLEDRIDTAEKSIKTENATEEWGKAIDAIRTSEMYRPALTITPQLDLSPLGPDPDSKLWEFAFLPSGVKPERGAGRRLVLSRNSAVVFVLIPGGALSVGGPDSLSIDIAPFFLSKYELTAAQWARLTHTWDPNVYDNNAMMPVAEITWTDSVSMLDRAASWLCLPDSCQWEYACRAGETLTWWTGNEEESLRGHENVMLDTRPNKNLGYVPVNMLSANKFGLHNMHGNVAEWCQAHSLALAVDRVRRPLRELPTPINPGGPGFSGGSFSFTPRDATSSSQNLQARTRVTANFVGVRPARILTP